MIEYYKTTLGRLRIAAMLEGISLLALIFVGVPLKYMMGMPELVKSLGPIHGALFLLYIFLTIGVAAEYRWKGRTISRIILACFIPFGTFYIDQKILKPIYESEKYE